MRPQPPALTKALENRLRKYGLTYKQFVELWNACGGACSVCFKAFTNTPNRKCTIDHDHETGYVRGLVCAACNYSLGTRTPEWFMSAGAYLRHWPAERLGIEALHREFQGR